jgi:non-ribosomal peptide synthetase component F
LNRKDYAENRPAMKSARVFYVESAGSINCPPSMIPAIPLPSPGDSLFQALQRHAQQQPDAIALASRFRLASYRKLWSRIERATARLQGVWEVGAGDVVAYCGDGHPDALVLYVALARCGALLLPLEHAAARAALPRLADTLALRLALFDDDLSPPRNAQPAYPLSMLIGEPCAYQARVATPDPDACSLLRLADDGSLRRLSLRQLAAEPASAGRDVHGALFDADVFGPVVLPALCAGDTLTWA